MSYKASDQLKIFLLCAIFESAVWGIALTKVIDALTIMRSRSHDSEMVALPVFIAAPLIFLLATIHLVGVIIRTYRGFVEYETPTDYFGLLTTHENTVCQAGQVGAILVSDLLSVYRVWIVCDRTNKAVLDTKNRVFPFPFKKSIVPFLGFLATLASAIVWVNTQRTTDPRASFYDDRVYRWTLTFLACGLFTTMTSTGLIARTLWKYDREFEREYRSHSPAAKALRIFVESAALYSITNLLYMAFYAGEFKGIHSVFSTLSSSIASITFSLITIRGERALRPENQGVRTHVTMSRIGIERERTATPNNLHERRLSDLHLQVPHLMTDAEEAAMTPRPSSATAANLDDISESPLTPHSGSRRSRYSN